MNSKRVAIIGAGLAGLTSAYRLMQCGLDIDIFEATSRVGGRVFTVFMKNYLGEIAEVELGGQNITDGGDATHLLQLAKELNLGVQEKVININELIYSETDKGYYNQLLSKHHNTAADIKRFAEQAENIGQLIELFCDGNQLLEQALFSKIMAYEGINPYKQSIYHNIETLKCTLSGGVAKAHESHSYRYNQVVTSFIKGGNAKLPIEIANKLAGKIYYNKVLKKIELGPTGAILRFQDQSIYDYDYVVLSVPVATFSSIDFSNSLQEDRLLKIKSIACGSNYKIALPINIKKINDVSSIIKENVLSFYNNDDTVQLLYVNDKAPNIQSFVNLLSYENYNSPTSNLTEAKNKNYETYAQSIYYNWKKDIYFQGSYTGYSTSVSFELDEITYHNAVPYKTLFAPINNTLFFAGEHATILACIGTMGAAVESGDRAAKAINKLTKSTLIGC